MNISQINQMASFFFMIMITLCSASITDAAEQRHFSPTAMAADNESGILYIAGATDNKIVVFDTDTSKISKTIATPSPVSGLAISPSGSLLYATVVDFFGKALVIDIQKGKIVSEIPTGHTAMSPSLSPDGNVLYICNQFNNNVSVIDLVGKKIIKNIPVVREPVASAMTADGKTLVIANHLPAGVADKNYSAAAVSLIDTASQKIGKNITLLNGSMGLKGVAVSPDGYYAYVTHLLVRYQLPTTQLERGWMNTNALSIIDIPAGELITTVLLDDIDLGAANPWSVACTSDGKFICVTHAGTHEVSIIDRIKLHKKIAKAQAGEKVSRVSSSLNDIPNDLSFLTNLRQRMKLNGNGPRSMAIIDTKLYCGGYFSDSIDIIDLAPEIRSNSVLITPPVPMTKSYEGEMLFHDATQCFQKWQSCASCHPDNARVDALNWDLLNDGMGNPKNTKSLLLAHQSPPAMITGVRDSAETAVRAGIRHILFSIRPESDAVAIDEYLKSLKPLQSPYLVIDPQTGKPSLSQSARRGAKIFKQAGCASCHTAPLYTNLKKYNVGTGRNKEKDIEFDTPTLIEVWRTAPYLYDGRAATIEEIFKEYNPCDVHGQTTELTDQQIKDLVEYVLSL